MSKRARIRKKLRQAWDTFTESPFYRLTIFFVLLFGGMAGLVTLLEIGQNEQFKSFFDGIWWAVITFSTVGYGDKSPVTVPGQAITMVAIFGSMALVSLLSGTFASVFVESNTRARRGLMDFPKLEDHIIICGWKNNMSDIVRDILELSDKTTAEKIVIISNIDSERIEALKELPALKKVKYIRGDYFSEDTLKRANIQRALKAIILGDTFESAGSSEADSKTVMTVLTIKSMAKDLYVCAELVDKKYEPYLRNAMCDEILFPRDLNRQMLAGTTVTNGLANILNNLVSNLESDTHLNTIRIDPKNVGETFGSYKENFSGDGSRMLIGILENTGSPNKVKMEAVREAQKTPDISKLVTNLQLVKDLSINKPVFIPADDYIIQKHSRAIVIERFVKTVPNSTEAAV
ncbi:MAG: potassium channel family protein [Spirochaetales bacterium]|uniref:Potassium channel family protein n=1 Tax=Candidatus Thalassospirochaeta sargassi TaxID=3119039 RepID=A0AAJ1IGF1_9SPIO|nr:potassium channel family protein [Spirochaetales bacterium]